MKTKITLALVALLFMISSCTSASDRNNSDSESGIMAPAGNLYLRTTMWSSGLSIDWIYLGNDGTIVFNPKHGVNPVNVTAENADNQANIGSFKAVGNTLQIKWKNGKTANWSFEKTKGDYSAIDGGIVTKPDALPANYKMTGQYAAGAVTANLSASSTLVFTADGKFTEGRLGGVSTAGGSATSSDQRAGTYNITGNTLKLKYSSGETYVAAVALYKIKDWKTYFIINNSSYAQEK